MLTELCRAKIVHTCCSCRICREVRSADYSVSSVPCETRTWACATDATKRSAPQDMGATNGRHKWDPANAELEHLTDVERADPVDVAPPAFAAEAEILRELREALDYRTAMSEILRVISGSAFDLTSVLLTVLPNAKTLCRADMAGLYRYQDGAYRFAVGDGLLPAYERVERRRITRAGARPIV